MPATSAVTDGSSSRTTAVAGTAELRDAIAHRHNVDFDSDYRREEVIASVGGKLRPVLNGKFVFQSGVLDQGYWPDGIYTPPSDAAMRFDVATAK